MARLKRKLWKSNWTHNLRPGVLRRSEAYQETIAKNEKELLKRLAAQNWKLDQIKKVKEHRAIAARTQLQDRQNQTGV